MAHILADTLHALRKLWSTLRMLTILGLARTFGHYQHSAGDNGLNYARYTWRGKDWAFPTSHFEELE